MGNQLAKPNDFDMGWLAGFIDGEGSINLHRRDYAEEYVGWRPWFTLANTHADTLNRVQRILDGCGLAYHVSWSDKFMKRKDGSNRRPIWRVQIVGLKRMYRFLVVFAPLLYTKRYQAELFLDFVNLRLANKGYKRGLSQEEQALIPRMISANR